MKVNVRPAVGWQALVLSGQLSHKITYYTDGTIVCQKLGNNVFGLERLRRIFLNVTPAISCFENKQSTSEFEVLWEILI